MRILFLVLFICCLGCESETARVAREQRQEIETAAFNKQYFSTSNIVKVLAIVPRLHGGGGDSTPSMSYHVLIETEEGKRLYAPWVGDTGPVPNERWRAEVVFDPRGGTYVILKEQIK